MVKDTIKRKKPSFNEAYHGYRTFSELLEDAQKEGLLELDTDKRSRTYVVTRFGAEMNSPLAAAPAKRRRRGRRRPARRGPGDNGPAAAAEPGEPAREPAPASEPPAQPEPRP